MSDMRKSDIPKIISCIEQISKGPHFFFHQFLLKILRNRHLRLHHTNLVAKADSITDHFFIAVSYKLQRIPVPSDLLQSLLTCGAALVEFLHLLDLDDKGCMCRIIGPQDQIGPPQALLPIGKDSITADSA